MYKVSFKVSPFQDFDLGSVVTYRNENLLEYIKETLYSKSNFFYISDINWNSYTCEISNGIDTIKTSPDQLVEVVAYLEKIEGGRKSRSGSRIENIIREEDKSNMFYVLEDQKMSISLENSTIPPSYFDLINSVVSIEDRYREYKLVRFKESIIADLF